MAKSLSGSKKQEVWQDPNSVPYIEIEGVSKSFGNFKALDNVSLAIYKNELFSLLGGSGCGKTTLLRILAGFEKPSSGKVYIDGIDMSDMPPYLRPVNMMFQSYALFPHMTAYQNVEFGLLQQGIPEGSRKGRVEDIFSLVQMWELRHRYPSELSGGQKQRVALARSLAPNPKLLLLDEPLGALDKKLREQTQFELVNIQEKLGITFIMVTHDQEEAMTMSSRLAVMASGRIVQVGAPHEVYEYPNCRYVADFIGLINLFEGIVEGDAEGHVTISSPDTECDLYVSHSMALPLGANVTVAVRPEKIMMTSVPRSTDRNCIKGIVKEIGYLGDVSIYHVLLPSGKVVFATIPNLLRVSERDVIWEDEVFLYWKADNGLVLSI